jgi:hypothetical protein
VTIGVEWVVLDGAFKDKGGSTSSSSGWMVCVVGGVSGNVDIAFPSEVCFGDEHDVYVMCIQKLFEFVSMLYEAVGVPNGFISEAGACTALLYFVSIVPVACTNASLWFWSFANKLSIYVLYY